MQYKIEDLIEIIYMKLKKNNKRKINLEKVEFNEFINYLINNS